MKQNKTSKNRFETALKHSEQRFRAIAGTSADAIISIDSESKLVFWNRAAKKMFGYNQTEIIGRDITILMPRRYRRRHKQGIKNYLDTGKGKHIGKTIELAALRKDGTEIPIELSLADWKTEEGIFFTGFIRDITERKRAEDAIKESEERYRTLAESAQDLIFIINKDLSVQYINRAAAKYIRSTPEEVVGKHLKDIFPPHIYKFEQQSLKKVIKTGKPRTFDNKFTLQKEIWLSTQLIPIKDESGKTSAVMGISRDVTRSKKTSDLSEALNEINTAINSTMDFNEIMQTVVVESAKVLGSSKSAVYLCEDGFWEVRYIYGFPQKIIGSRFSDKEAPYAAAAARIKKPVVGRSVCYNDVAFSALMAKFDIKSALFTPLIVKEDVIGIIIYGYESETVPFTEEEIDFSSKMAASVALSIENTRLYTSERNIADTLQESLLMMPQGIKGADFSYLYHSATEAAQIGGDFYDIFELEHDKIGIIIGDVSGKGLEAASLTSLVKNTIKAYAYQERSPAAIITKTNDVIIKSAPSSIYVTVIFGILDTKTGIFFYCDAGHPPAILKKKADKTHLLRADSPAIGVFPDLNFKADEERLEKSDALIFYTDGVTEAKRNHNLFGERKLLKYINNYKKPVKTLPQNIFNEIMGYTGGTLSDDVALLSVQLKP